ncbi:MAG: RluA family pseudouridine synthase [Treponemataceae bacterium]|nr:RluA family pseudouridine synthase [Treponemataceae bacterium]
MRSIEVIYENEEIFVINKASGLAVQGGQGVTHSVDMDMAEQIGQKIYLVHRLDKDTAGLMIVAKNPPAASKWTKLISSREVKKIYEAVCIGRISPEKGVIREALVQHGSEREAVTHYEVLKKWEVSNEDTVIPMEKIRLTLETGRMHQIRIHLAGKRCFIAGDDKHGDFRLNKILKKTCGIKRLLLASVSLTIPEAGKEKVFTINLPEHFPAESR